jgi:hypothetical protein
MSNTPRPYVDAAPYCEIVGALYRAGMEFSTMHRITRLERKTLRKLAFGESERIQQRTAERVRLLIVVLPSESEVA